MADKTIGELPGIAGLYDDSLIPVEQQGVASRMTGKQFADFGRDAGREAAAPEVEKAAAEARKAAQDAQRSVAAADAAEKSRDGAMAEADRAEELRGSIEVDYEALHRAVETAEGNAGSAAQSAGDAAGSAKLAKSWAVGGTGARSGEDTDNAKYYSEKSKASADSAAGSVQIIRENAGGIQAVKDNLAAILSAPDHARSAAESAQSAAAEADRSEDAASLSESWAVGGTGTRQDEDENNARYWAGRAQAEAERASVPPVEGVYNIVLEDRITGERYALIVERGRPALLGVSETLEAASPLIIDQTDGRAYGFIVENGKLKIKVAA